MIDIDLSLLDDNDKEPPVFRPGTLKYSRNGKDVLVPPRNPMYSSALFRAEHMYDGKLWRTLNVFHAEIEDIPTIFGRTFVIDDEKGVRVITPGLLLNHIHDNCIAHDGCVTLHSDTYAMMKCSFGGCTKGVNNG